MSTAILVTTLNEEATIGKLVTSFTQWGWDVFVVDDSSEDDTALVAFENGAKNVWGHESRIGIGPSLLEGWRRIRELGYHNIIQIDAGGSHDPDDCIALIRASVYDRADIVIGSRFRGGASYDNTNGSWKRPILSRIASFAMNRVQFGAHHSDWTSGYRYFNQKALDVLLKRTYHAKMHAWQIEVLAYAGEEGLKITESPISYVAGRSSFNHKVANEAFMTFLHVANHVRHVGAKHV